MTPNLGTKPKSISKIPLSHKFNNSLKLLTLFLLINFKQFYYEIRYYSPQNILIQQNFKPFVNTFQKQMGLFFFMQLF